MSPVADNKTVSVLHSATLHGGGFDDVVDSCAQFGLFNRLAECAPLGGNRGIISGDAVVLTMFS